MSFWTEPGLQPKRNYRFKITIPSLVDGAGAPQNIIWWAKNFKPPSYSVSEATHDYMDNKYYYPGRVTWEDCTMQLVDPVSPNAVALTNAILMRSGYVVKTTPGGSPEQLQTISKNNATIAMGDIVVDILTADGVVIEKWTLNNPFLKAASFSTLEYANDDLRTIDVTFRYDWATCDNYGPESEVGAGNEGDEIIAEDQFAKGVIDSRIGQTSQ